MPQIKLGDETMSVLEIWGAEYQENDCLLIKPEDRHILEAVCARERCLMQVQHSREAWRLPGLRLSPPPASCCQCTRQMSSAVLCVV